MESTYQNKAQLSYAIYGEYPADTQDNREMPEGLYNRCFNHTEIEVGKAIRLESEEKIRLLPGTYRISGLSIAAMMTGTEPVWDTRQAYAGYCLLYDPEATPVADPGNCICLGSPSVAMYLTPSIFECVLTCEKETVLCLGHQCGYDPKTAWKKVYARVGGDTPHHLFARIAIYQMA